MTHEDMEMLARSIYGKDCAESGLYWHNGRPAWEDLAPVIRLHYRLLAQRQAREAHQEVG